MFTAAFVIVWLEAVSCFGFFMILSRDASPVATSAAPAAIINHGHALYVAVWRKRLYDALLTAMMIGIPSIMAAGWILHYGVGVKIFDGRR